MSLLDTLSREHRLFLSLLDRMERALGLDSQTAHSEVRGALLVLLPALERHQEIEELVFGPDSEAGASRTRQQLAVQHRAIGRLRADLEGMLARSDGRTIGGLRLAVLPLVKKLRQHFETEERRLWPACRRRKRPLLSAIDREAAARVRALEAQMEQSWRMINDYLGRR